MRTASASAYRAVAVFGRRDHRPITARPGSTPARGVGHLTRRAAAGGIVRIPHRAISLVPGYGRRLQGPPRFLPSRLTGPRARRLDVNSILSLWLGRSVSMSNPQAIKIHLWNKLEAWSMDRRSFRAQLECIGFAISRSRACRVGP